MLIDATHPEETRVVVLDGKRLEEFDFETASRKALKGNIYLAKVIRVEPSLQAAFVEYGGNRHGFLAFSEIHPDYYRIPIADREALLAEHAGDEGGASAARVPIPTDNAEPPPAESGETTALEPPIDENHAVEAGESEAESPSPEPAEPSEEPVGEMPRQQPSAAGAALEAGESAAETGFEVVGGDDAEEEQRRRVSIARRYKIQEVVKRRQIMLVQVTKEERGSKGAALTTYLSLAGRYCVLMPNSGRGGGVSRKISQADDRKRLKSIVEDLAIPDGMAVIVRTAGSERNKTEIKRDYEYLLRLWNDIRDLTLQSTAPAVIYEEANLIKRSIRDLYSRDTDEIVVEGEEGYKTAKAFMRMLTPSHAKRVQLYNDPSAPLFQHHQIESQLDAIHNPVVQLKSGGYIVMNSTEALVAIDVNSGRATRERHIEATALKTNLEAADEVARQLRLRDLAGLIVIDFIDMEEGRHNAAVERCLKEAMRHDRARIQLGRISHFGLLELSRQRLRPSLVESSTEICAHCRGVGRVRSTESTALHVLRSIEEEGMRRRSAAITVTVPSRVALYIANQKRQALTEIEARHDMRTYFAADDSLVPPEFRLDRLKAHGASEERRPPVVRSESAEEPETEEARPSEALAPAPAPSGAGEEEAQAGRRRSRRRRRRGRDGEPVAPRTAEAARRAKPEPPRVESAALSAEPGASETPQGEAAPEQRPGDGERRRRRRGRRGGRRRSHREGGRESPGTPGQQGEQPGHPIPTPAAVGAEIDRQPLSATEPAWAEEPEAVVGVTPNIDAERASDEPLPTIGGDTPMRESATEEAPEQPTRRGWWRRSGE